MKKVFGAIVTVFAVLGSALAFSACSDGKHTAHDFTGAWVTTDPDYHWHECKAEGCNETDEKVAHVWVDNTDKADVAATCIADGIHYLKCSECGAEKSEAIKTRPDHDFTGAWITTDPDKHWHECKTEGCEETDEKVAHDWVDDESKPDKSATCIADGEHYLKCSGCGAEKSTPITPRPDHDFTGELVTTDPDYHYHVCTTEGCNETDEKAAHAWEDGDVITPPDADNDGSMKITCPVCNAESSKVIPATGHPKGNTLIYKEGGTTHWYGCTAHSDCGRKYDEKSHDFKTHLEAEDKAASCKESGYTVWQCECGAKERRTVPKTDEHNYAGQQYISDGAGGHHQVCKVCGESSQTVAHSLVDGATITEPTFWEAGSKNVSCEHCDYEGTETVEKLTSIEHNKTFNTENQDGYWKYGRVDVTDWNGNDFKYNLTPSTDGSDGWKAEGVQIKGDWLSVNAIGYIAFTAKEDVTVKFDIALKKVTDKYVDVRTVLDNQARLHGAENYTASELAFSETYTLTEGQTVYIMFSAGTGDGHPQADYSLTVTKVA